MLLCSVGPVGSPAFVTCGRENKETICHHVLFNMKPAQLDEPTTFG